MKKTTAPEALLQRLRSAQRLLVTSHANPDGDAVGASVGLARMLGRLGKGALIWHRDPVPTLYHPLPGTERIHTGTEPPAGYPDRFDVAVVLECPTLDRCGLEERIASLPLINIDHHLGNQIYGAVNWVDATAPAVGEMIYRVARGLGMTIDDDTATALFMALVTDTGGFRFSNASPLAFDSAAALVRDGARPDRVAGWLYDSRPESSVRLQGEMLATLELHHEGRIATALLTPEMFARARATAGDAEGLIDVPRSIAGVDAVALLRQLPGGAVKVSLRSSGEINVEQVARRHGGGGHPNAAGMPAQGEIAAIRKLMVGELAASLDAASSDEETGIRADSFTEETPVTGGEMS